MMDEDHEHLLSFSILHCDGGCYSPEFPVTSLLEDNQSVYSSDQKPQVNIILSRTCSATPLQGAPFIPRKILIRIPIKGFTSPLKEGFIFLCREIPNLNDFSSFDDLPTEDLLMPHKPNNNINADEPLTVPSLPTVPSYVVNVVFFRMARSTPLFEYTLCQPLSVCRFILIKFLRSFGSGENVDVQYFGVVGDDYKISFPFAQLI